MPVPCFFLLSMLNEYLDVNGRKIPQDKTPLPAFEGQRKTSGGEVAAHYVRCKLPRVCGFLWVGHCLKCKFYAGTYGRGIACRYNGKSAENYEIDGLKVANKKKMQKSEKSLQKICIYQKIVVPLHRHLKRNGTNQIRKPK